MADESLIAVFIDFENLAIGLRPQKFNPEVILRRFLEKGRIVHKRAYCDWVDIAMRCVICTPTASN